jgi:mono/diheme cytochrome c family protein
MESNRVQEMRVQNAVTLMLSLLALASCTHLADSNANTLNQGLSDAGHQVAALKCARCHAIDQSDSSDNPSATPFRQIAVLPVIMASPGTLREGIRIGHVDMPPIRLSPTEVDELRAYLRDLRAQAGEGTPRPN